MPIMEPIKADPPLEKAFTQFVNEQRIAPDYYHVNHTVPSFMEPEWTQLPSGYQHFYFTKGELEMRTINDEIQALYQQLIDAWNKRDAHGMAAQFSEQGVQIGFDGSKVVGKAEILSHLIPIFENHPTAPFITKVKSIRPLGTDAALLHAIAGMIPIGKKDIEPSVNAHQTLVAVKKMMLGKLNCFKTHLRSFMEDLN